MTPLHRIAYAIGRELGWVLGTLLALLLTPLFWIGNIIRWWDDQRQARAGRDFEPHPWDGRRHHWPTFETKASDGRRLDPEDHG